MRITTTILLSIVWLFPASSGTAQDLTTSTFQEIAQRETNSIKATFQLSSRQADSIGVIQLQFYRSMALLSPALLPEQRKHHIDSLINKKQQSLQSVLTRAQWDQYTHKLETQKAKIQKEITERRQKRIGQQQAGN